MLKRFFQREKKEQNLTPRLYLGVFGKHPGWDDHIEDIGIDTDCLINVKRMLYFQGIEGNIQAGSWKELDENQRLDGYRHLFVWLRGNDVVIGRMWSSSDGKGRTEYPMVVCGQCCNLRLAWITDVMLPRLEKIERQCKATTSAADVQRIIADAYMELKSLIPRQPSESSKFLPDFGVLTRLANRPEMGPDHTGLHRILYHIEREMAAYRIAGTDTSANASFSPPPVHLRVPVCADTRARAVLLWTNTLFTRIDPNTNVLLLLPQDETWVDIVVGEPSTMEFYCLRASLEAIPLTSSIPYDLNSDFVERAETLIDNSRSGKSEPSQPLIDPTAVAQKSAANIKQDSISGNPRQTKEKKSRLGKFLLLLLVLVIIAAVLFGLSFYDVHDWISLLVRG